MENKKKIAMVSIDYVVNKALIEQLNQVFGKEVNIVPILLSENEKIEVEGLDLIVCTSKAIVGEIEERINRKVPIIPVRRNIDLKKITEVIAINDGEKVSLVNSHLYTANEIIDLFKELGVDYIDFIPYYPGCENKIEDIVVTPGGTHLVPLGVKRIIDIGIRFIDISSIMEIFVKLDLPMENLHGVSVKYSKEMVRLIKFNIETNKILKAIFEVANDGIAALDVSGNIFFSNDKFASVLDYKQNDLISRNITDIIKDRQVIDNIMSLEHRDHEIVEIRKKEFMLNKTLLYQGNMLKGYVLGLQEVTFIQNLDKEVRKKLVSKGFVAKYNFDDLVGTSARLSDKVNIAKKMAKSDWTVLIEGETGTGKEVFAQAIHNASIRKNEPFVAVNFAAISENLLESELFGYEEGAFTGAIKGGKVGLFEQADKGTIFIDEIGDASLQIQTRLLRVLQEKQIMRVGGSKIIPIDVRVIAATNRNLAELVEKQEFRKDLYYRLKVLYFNLPKLEERKEDIPLLAKYYLTNLGSSKRLSKEVEDIFNQYSWPGNVRELENLMCYIDNIADNECVTKNDLPEGFFNGIHKNNKVNNNLLGEIDYELFSKDNICEYIAILNVLDNAKRLGIKIGRNKISKVLEDSNIYLSSQQVRYRLKDLEKMDFVKIEDTKKGTIITERGKAFLTEHGNELGCKLG